MDTCFCHFHCFGGIMLPHHAGSTWRLNMMVQQCWWPFFVAMICWWNPNFVCLNNSCALSSELRRRTARSAHPKGCKNLTSNNCILAQLKSNQTQHVFSQTSKPPTIWLIIRKAHRMPQVTGTLEVRKRISLSGRWDADVGVEYISSLDKGMWDHRVWNSHPCHSPTSQHEDQTNRCYN
jgi:hypothetical protein